MPLGILLVACCPSLALADPFFQSHVDYPAIEEPFAVAVGDLNNDTHPDLVVSAFFMDGLSVYFGVGDGTFQPQIYSGGGNFGYNLGLGNINADEWLDVVKPDEGSIYALLYSGTGTGSFAFPYRMDTPGPSPSHVALADFNKDTRLDIAITNWGNPGSVGIHLGNGDGTFGAGVTFETGPGPRGIAVGDVNGDGNLDIAVANEGYTGVDLSIASVLLGYGNGTFGPKTIYGVGLMPEGIALDDLNGDQKLDLVTAGQDGNVAVLMNDGTGVFGPMTLYDAGGWHFSVAVADIDLDGKKDIVVPDAGFYNSLGRVGVLRGVGDGTFEAAIFHDTWFGASGIAVADLNHDGRLDAVAATRGGLGTLDSYISVLLNCVPCIPTSVSVVLTSAEARDGGVCLTWYVPYVGHTIVGSVQRRTQASEWTSISEPAPVYRPEFRYTDATGTADERYGYRLELHDGSEVWYSNEMWVLAPSKVSTSEPWLMPAYPSPSRGLVLFRFSLPGTAHVRLRVFDVGGHLLATVLDREELPGLIGTGWFGLTADNRRAPSGVYVAVLEVDGRPISRKFVLAR